MKKTILLILAICSTALGYAATKTKPQQPQESAELIAIKPLSKMQQAVKESELANAQTYSNVRDDATPLSIMAIAATRIDLVKGKPIDQQFGYYAKMEGWVLIWDASEFVLDNNASLKGDFETALTSFLTGTNESGSRLRATFYRGNKTVRVQEF
jgi:hypothetical protein